LEAGKRYQITATGRYKIAQTTQPWWSEPGGVTIRYYRGKPLGMVLGVVRPEVPQSGVSTLILPDAIGLERVTVPRRSGTLYLRVNDSPAELSDNAGSVSVRIGWQSSH
jgi:hypothetical protein